MRLHQVWEILAQAVDIPARTGSISSPSTYANPLKNGRGEKTRLGGNGDRGAAGDAKRTTHPRRLGMQDLNEQSTARSEEHTSELQSLMRNSYAVFCLKKKKTYTNIINTSARIQKKQSHALKNKTHI